MPEYIVRGHKDPDEHHRRMWVLHGEKKAPDALCPLRECTLSDGHMDRPPHSFHRKANGDTFPTPDFTDLTALTKRRARAEVADRLRAALYPDQWAPNLDLEGYLLEVSRRVGALNVPLDSIKATVRDAALEEAALALKDWLNGPADIRDCFEIVRAMKSKPAPDCLTPGCEKPTGHAGPHEPCGARKAPQQCQHPSCTLPPHDGPHEDTNGMTYCVQPSGNPGELPVHDFGWALQQMRAGKKVRRAAFIPSAHYRLDGCYVMNHTSTTQHLMPWDDLTATDWQVME